MNKRISIEQNKTVYISFIGCQNLRYEVRQIAAFVRQNGFIQTDTPATADYIILAGCGVTAYTEEVTLKKIWDTVKITKPDAVKIVYGCILATSKEEEFRKHNLITIKRGEEEKFNEVFSAAVKIGDAISNVHTNNQNIGETFSTSTMARPLSDERKKQKELCTYLDKLHKTDKFTEAFEFCTTWGAYWSVHNDIFEIKTGRGCIGNCSFCTERKVNGSIKSVSREKILSQIKAGIKLGYEKFSFIADEVGYWGIDINDDLCNLLDDISNIKDKEKVPIKLILCYFHPDKIVESYERLLPHFLSGLIFAALVPFQTGSPKIMKLMNRHTDLEKLKLVLKDMHEKKVPTYIAGQIMVGFPSETMDNFYETVEFIRDANFDLVDISDFSKRPGTPAFKFRRQLSAQEISRRWQTISRYLNSFRSKQLLYRIVTIFGQLKNSSAKTPNK